MRPMLTRSFMVLTAVVCGSCDPDTAVAEAPLAAAGSFTADDTASGGDDGGGRDDAPAPRAATLDFMPEDLQTSAADTPPTVLLPFGTLSEADERDLLRRFRLVRWPSRERVEGRVIYVPEGGVDAPDRRTASSRIVFIPDRPLAESWYAIEGSLPPDVLLGSTGRESGRGTVVSRFYSAPRLIVRSVIVGTPASSATDGVGATPSIEVIVEFSERVRREQLGGIALRADGAGCVLRGTETTDPDGGTMTAAFDCPSGRAGPSSVSIAVGGLVTSVAGLELSDATGRPLRSLEAVTADAVALDAAGVRTVRPSRYGLE